MHGCHIHFLRYNNTNNNVNTKDTATICDTGITGRGNTDTYTLKLAHIRLGWSKPEPTIISGKTTPMPFVHGGGWAP
jgi:hypothetical protein